MGRGEKGGDRTGEGGGWGCINVPKRSSNPDFRLLINSLWSALNTYF